MLAPTFEKLYLDEINRKTIAEYVSARKRTGVTDATIRRDLAYLSSLCVACVRWGWLDTNPVMAFRKRGLKESRPRTRFLTKPEFERLLASASPNVRVAIILAVETGLRKEELLGLSTDAIDLPRREIHLEKTKTNSPRRVPLWDTALVTIKALIGDTGRPRSRYLLCKTDGSRYLDLKTGFGAACRRASITNVRCHDLRHVFASWFVRRGENL